MGQYEPNDSRDVTQNQSNVPGEPPRTGPREDKARERSHQSDDDDGGEKDGKKTDEQFGYGDRDDTVSQPNEGTAGKTDGGENQAGEGSDDPDDNELLVDEPGKVAHADAQRPLGGD